jgi:hypothetical protein
VTQWTYYQQTYPNGDWSLFREAEGRKPEIFHRLNGWTADNELLVRKLKGDIGQDDIIGEEKAFALIRSLEGRDDALTTPDK